MSGRERQTAVRPATVLSVENLAVEIEVRRGTVRAVDGVSFSLRRGETLGIVGESGCGKSMTALSIMGLAPRGSRLSGRIRFGEQELLGLSEAAMRTIRGNRIAMIFQEPMTSLNPVMSIGRQIAEAVVLHRRSSRREAWARAVQMLRMVGIPDPAQRAREYPHQLSGGMRQRAMIAMAPSCNPEILIADEPTTALDVTIQAQVMDLLLALKRDLGASIILITHDLGVVAETCQRVVIMYAGRKVEELSASDLFERPRHPYTRGLLASLPAVHSGGAARTRLSEIPGSVPSMHDSIVGCGFAPRCALADDRCRRLAPQLRTVSASQSVACWKDEFE
jgi:peptide/nickel transport system ATP-binding protein